MNTEGWTTLLDNSSVWRVFRTNKLLMIKRGDKLEELPEFYKGLGENYSDRKQIVTIFPPDGWAAPDFADSEWQQRHFFAARDEKEMAGETGRNWLQTNQFHHLRGGPNQRQLTLRGKFVVDDPTAVKRLVLGLVFRGGVVVYLNGQEVGRAFLPAGKLEPGALAEIYPDGAYVKTDGHYWQPWWDGEASKNPPELWIQKVCYPLRLRRLTGVEVPVSLLRKGVNVLGVEIHAAPYLPGKAARLNENNSRPWWTNSGLVELRLQASSAAGIVPNVVRPAGIQVWNLNPGVELRDIEYGDNFPFEKPRPLAVVGVRNGTFSGRVVVSSDKPIKGLGARISDLSTADGKKIPAAAIELGYGKFDVAPVAGYGRAPTEVEVLYPGLEVLREQGILSAPPAEAAVRPIRPKGGGAYLDPAARQKDGLPPYVPGAFQSVWVLANVPRDAAAGDYQGVLTIALAGEKPIEVPVQLKVLDWTLPAPADYTYFSAYIQSPEGVALPYDIPRWGDKNWEYAGKSLEYLGKIGNKILFVMVGAESQHGNSESLVRWVKGEGGKYSYDFSRVEKYVDLALKKMGKPRFVVVGVWDSNKYGQPDPVTKKKRSWARFTVEDPKTHAVTTENGPEYDAPESLEFWKPVLTGVKAVLDRRELGEAMLLGYCSDTVPNVKAATTFAAILPGVGWQGTNHMPEGNNVVPIEGGKVPVLFKANVYGFGEIPEPKEKRLYGWQSKGAGGEERGVLAWYPRETYDGSPLARIFGGVEACILSGRRGLGQIGADLWTQRDKSGSVSALSNTLFPSSMEGDMAVCLGSLLYPGSDGPAPSVAYVLVRESIEEAEARIFVEKLLLDKKLPDDVAGKCQEVLDDRAILWKGESTIQPRSDALRVRLFQAAADAAKAVGVNGPSSAPSR